MHVYMDLCARIYVHVCTYLCLCVFSYMCVYVYVCTYVYTYMHIYTHMCTYVYTYIHIHIHTCIYVYVWIYTYTCIHTHTHIYIYRHTYTVHGDTKFYRLLEWNGAPVTTARVYVLEYTSVGEKYYFWMQQPDLESDDVLYNRCVVKLNAFELAG